MSLCRFEYLFILHYFTKWLGLASVAYFALLGSCVERISIISSGWCMNARHWWSLSTGKWDLGCSSSWQQTEPLKRGPILLNIEEQRCATFNEQWRHPRFPRTITLLPRGRALRSACCLQTGPLWTMSCVVSAFRNAAHKRLLLVFQVFKTGLFLFHITVLAQGRTFFRSSPHNSVSSAAS